MDVTQVDIPTHTSTDSYLDPADLLHMKRLAFCAQPSAGSGSIASVGIRTLVTEALRISRQWPPWRCRPEGGRRPPWRPALRPALRS